MTAGGNVLIPINAEAFGFWLKAALDLPTTAGAEASYTYEFRSGNWALRSVSVATGMPEVPCCAIYSSCMVDSLNRQMGRVGLLTATASIVTQWEIIATSTAVGTPNNIALKGFGHFYGTSTRNGAVNASRYLGRAI